jgi:NADH dehydrogenase FAD-containing subunit
MDDASFCSDLKSKAGAMAEIVVVGGGFAGLWASLAAVRELELTGGAARVSIVSADP